MFWLDLRSEPMVMTVPDVKDDRYLVNSAMIEEIVFEDDGSLVIHVQKDPPIARPTGYRHLTGHFTWLSECTSQSNTF